MAGDTIPAVWSAQLMHNRAPVSFAFPEFQMVAPSVQGYVLLWASPKEALCLKRNGCVEARSQSAKGKARRSCRALSLAPLAHRQRQAGLIE